MTVCDARPTFATAARLPGADEVVVRWPHQYLREEAEAGRIDRRTALTVLTHDPKFDIPLLEVALRLDVAFVGAMGSRRTHEEREAQLRAAGVTEAELARLSSPIGLDLGRGPGGDRGLDRRGDHRPPVGRCGHPAVAPRRPHPPPHA
ncbi:XdhC family protein [Janibacter melonis]|uniref:XdhC family protein n=1 Tax=Janibacter melonis TaxID=262209 RepID=UPI0027DA184F|nr:XdhC family protein [Janibacter melonis]